MTDDLYAKLRAAYSSKDDAVPKGYKSCKQYAAEWGFSVAHTVRILNANIDKGILAKIDLKVGGRRVPHYGLAKKR